MIKYFCDRCGKECGKGARTIERFAYDGLGIKIVWIRNDHLCKECDEKFMSIHDKLKNEDDIFDMTDEEIELLRYTFKVGDQVITSTGEVGVIKDICTCDSCKKRGFYEPTIETQIGNWSIWITDSDKKNGFKSFYKIGGHIFGNIDEQCVLDDIEYKKNSLRDIQKQLDELEIQLKTVRALKENNDGN